MGPLEKILDAAVSKFPVIFGVTALILVISGIIIGYWFVWPAQISVYRCLWSDKPAVIQACHTLGIKTELW